MLSFLWLFGMLVTTTGQSPVSSPARVNSQPAQQAGWQYQQTVEPSGGTTYRASLLSTDQVQLPYPATGGSTVTLTIRSKSGNKSTAYFSVTKGLLTKSFQGGSAQIRFDAAKAVAYTVSAAANGSGNLVFIDDTERFIRQLKTAKSMSVQLTLANQPLNTIQFKTAGLRWSH